MIFIVNMNRKSLMKERLLLDVAVSHLVNFFLFHKLISYLMLVAPDLVVYQISDGVHF